MYPMNASGLNRIFLYSATSCRSHENLEAECLRIRRHCILDHGNYHQFLYLDIWNRSSRLHDLVRMRVMISYTAQPCSTARSVVP